MSAVKNLIDMGIATQSTALLGENYNFVRRSFSNRKVKARDGARKILNLGITNVVGVGLLKSQADLAGDL